MDKNNQNIIFSSDQVIQQRGEELLSTLQYSKGETDRGITLIIAAHIEECLRRIIEVFLIDNKEVTSLFEGPYAPFGSLSGKTKAAFVMGLITKNELKNIDIVRAVRNVFAHEVNANFEHPKIKKACAKPEVSESELCERDSFLHLAQNTVLPLLYRDIDIKKNKRTELTIEQLDKSAMLNSSSKCNT